MCAHVRALLACVAVALTACGGGEADGKRAAASTVVVYAAVDPVVWSELKDGASIPVVLVGDTEANKSVGLVERLQSEAHTPRADVLWMGEFSRLGRLCGGGTLKVFDNDTQAGPGACWSPFAGRARVIVVHESVPDRPRSIEEVTTAKWSGRVAIADPHFGTTGAHFAALYARWGEQQFATWVRALRANRVAVLPGNAQVKDAVANGRFAWGLTDSDDVNGAILDGAPVQMVIPDQETELGVLIIPNAVSLVVGGPNPGGARKVAEYLLSPEMEARLARSRSANIPLRHDVPGPPGFPKLSDLRVMDVSYDAVMEALPEMLRTWDREWQHAP